MSTAQQPHKFVSIPCHTHLCPWKVVAQNGVCVELTRMHRVCFVAVLVFACDREDAFVADDEAVRHLRCVAAARSHHDLLQLAAVVCMPIIRFGVK